MLVSSYEAEQHLLHFGRADAPMCWTISGLISGYISRTAGKEIYVLEDRCVGKGDAGCHLLARTREEWGDERAEELRIYQPERLKDCLDVSLKAAERKLRERRRALVQVTPEDHHAGSVAKSPAMRKLVDLARRVAKVDSTVLITGESGTGKERVARFIHDESTRALGPFIAVNCGAITETLLESELFGHARGAFTGAAHDRPGLFEAAEKGAAGAGGSAGRREQGPAGGCAGSGRHQPGPGPGRGQRHLPPGSLLPAPGGGAARAGTA